MLLFKDSLYSKTVTEMKPEENIALLSTKQTQPFLWTILSLPSIVLLPHNADHRVQIFSQNTQWNEGFSRHHVVCKCLYNYKVQQKKKKKNQWSSIVCLLH